MSDIQSAQRPSANQTASRPPSYIPNERVCAELIEHFRQSLDSKTPEWLEKVSRELSGAFAEWKEASGDRSPRRWYEGKGLPRRKSISFADAEPFECAPADAGVCDYPTLLLHLVYVKDQRVSLILDSERLDEILAVSVLLAPSLVRLDSLLMCLRLHDRVPKSLAKESDLEQFVSETAEQRQKAKKQDDNLKIGRILGTQKRQKASAHNRIRWQEEAINLINRYGLTLREAAGRIATDARLNPLGRSTGTIQSALQGCVSEAKKRLRAAK